MKRTLLLILVALMIMVVVGSSGAGAQEEVTISMWTHDNLYVEFLPDEVKNGLLYIQNTR